MEQGRPSFLSVGAETFNGLLRGTKFRIRIWWCIMLALHTDTKENNYEHQQNHINHCSCCPRDIVSNAIISYQIISSRQQGFIIPALYYLRSVTRLSPLVLRLRLHGCFRSECCIGNRPMAATRMKLSLALIH